MEPKFLTKRSSWHPLQLHWVLNGSVVTTPFLKLGTVLVRSQLRVKKSLIPGISWSSTTSLNLQRNDNSRFLGIFKTSNQWSQLFPKPQKKPTFFMKTPLRTSGFMSKFIWILQFFVFWESWKLYQNQFFDFFVKEPTIVVSKDWDCMLYQNKDLHSALLHMKLHSSKALLLRNGKLQPWKFLVFLVLGLNYYLHVCLSDAHGASN